MGLGEAAAALGLRAAGEDAAFHGVSTDSRTTAAGALFVAVRGPRFDGHDFVGAAATRGAAAALVEREPDAPAPIPFILVRDSVRALGELAAAWRRRFRDLVLVGITGSNGKTTVKEMVASIFRTQGPVSATRGNLNNEIGVPLTLCGLDAGHRTAVVELGANHRGEIASLTALARPSVGVITQCAPAHLEGFGSVEGVARAKGELFEGLPDDAVAVVNADDSFAELWRGLARPRRCISFGAGADADVRVRVRPGAGPTHVSLDTPVGSVEIVLALAGTHNAFNAGAAAAAAIAAGAGLDAIREGLACVRPEKGRLESKRGPRGAEIIDDTYNANPVSLRAGLPALGAKPGPHGAAAPGGGEPARGSRVRRAAPWRAAPARRRRAQRRGRARVRRRRDPLPRLRRAGRPAPRRAAGRRDGARQGVALDGDGTRGRGDRARGALMLLSLTEWLAATHSGFNVFQYLTLRAILGALTALAISLIVGPFVIRRLTRSHIGQTVRNDGPQSHLAKTGTPTMGGALILIAVTASTFFWADLGNRFVWVVLLVTLLFGAIGWADDYRKLVRGDPRGLPARQKYFWQSAVGLGCAVFLYHTAELPVETQLIVPFFKNVVFDLGWGYVVLTYFVIVGSSNAVNLTDGLDGLAILPTVMVAGALGIFAYVTGHANFSGYLGFPHIAGAGEIVVLCGSIVGAGLGFLWFNTYPAQVFMGDVGALALGAALGIVAVLVRQELVLLIMGGVFVMETLSVILQVASFKLTGKRLFRMAPLHHHFELKGWPEPRVIVRFWVITVVLVLVGLSTLKIR